jgi:hypothetical protein
MIMKKYLFILFAFAFVSVDVFGQTRPELLDGMTPEKSHRYNKGVCFVIVANMARVPNARDHGRPMAIVQEEIQRTFAQYGIAPAEIAGWLQKVESIYNSDITADTVGKLLRPPCDKMPD